jgi:hypothetical protein
VHNSWYVTCCCALGTDHLAERAGSIPSMRSVKQPYPKLVFDPTPCTCSNEDILKAQAIREALRRELLDRAEPQANPHWTVGVD